MLSSLAGQESEQVSDISEEERMMKQMLQTLLRRRR